MDTMLCYLTQEKDKPSSFKDELVITNTEENLTVGHCSLKSLRISHCCCWVRRENKADSLLRDAAC